MLRAILAKGHGIADRMWLVSILSIRSLLLFVFCLSRVILLTEACPYLRPKILRALLLLQILQTKGYSCSLIFIHSSHSIPLRLYIFFLDLHRIQSLPSFLILPIYDNANKRENSISGVQSPLHMRQTGSSSRFFDSTQGTYNTERLKICISQVVFFFVGRRLS